MADKNIVINHRGDTRAIEKLPDDSATRSRLIAALTNSIEARSWPPIQQYATQAQYYVRSPWVHLAATQIARAAALVKLNAFEVVDEQKNGLINHPIEQLLRHPNKWQSQFELIEQTMGFLQISGNAYWFLYSENGGTPDEIIILRPDRVRIVAGGDARNLVGGYVYYMQGMEVPIEANEVVHFKKFHPLSDYYGLSPIESILADVQGDQAMSEYNRNFFGRDVAVPAGVVNIKNPISQLEFERIKAEWSDSYGGKSRRTAFLQGSEVEYQDIGLTHKESEFLKGRQFTKEEVMIIYGIPPGMLDKSSTQANATVALEFFIDHTIWPEMTAFSQKITNDVAPFYGTNIVVEPEDIRPKDAESERTELAAYGPYLTINEIRARYLNLPPVPWGDQPATGGGTLLAPAALQGFRNANTNPVNLEKQSGSNTDTKQPGNAAKPAVAVRQHDVGRTRSAQREVTQYAKFVLNRAGTDKEASIYDFEFTKLEDTDASAIKALVEDDFSRAKWFLDAPVAALRDSECTIQRSDFSLKTTQEVVRRKVNDTLESLSMQTGLDTKLDFEYAITQSVKAWDTLSLQPFKAFARNQSYKLLDDTSALNREALFAQESASRLETFGVVLATVQFCRSNGLKLSDNCEWTPEHISYCIEPIVSDGQAVSFAWTPLKAIGHILGHPLPNSESNKVTPFDAHEINRYFDMYNEVISGHTGSH